MDHSTPDRPACPSLSPGVCSNSCPSSWWFHTTISSSVTPFSSCPHSFPASGAFTISWLFTLGSQNIGASASASVLPMISFRNHWFDLLAVQGNLKSLLQHHVQKHPLFSAQLSLWSNSHIHTWLPEKPIARIFVSKVMSCFLICCLGWSQLFFQGASVF